MNQNTLRRIHYIYGIVLSCLIVILGICFIVSCISIYMSGERPFTRESVGAQLKALLVPIILCVLGIIGGIVLSFFPVDEEKTKGAIDKAVLVKKLGARCDFENAPIDLVNEIKREKKLRLITVISCIFLNVIATVVALVYLLNTSNFPAEDLNMEIARSMIFVLPCTVIGLGAIFATVLITGSSISRELEITKKVLRVSKKAGASDEIPVTESTEALNIARIAIVVLAVAFIIIGIFNGGMADVLGKAIRICTECIGLG